MRVGFDGTNILGHGGIKTYARELLRGLATEFPDDSFHVLTTFSASKRDKVAAALGGFPNLEVRSAVPHRLMLGEKLLPATRIAGRILWRSACRGLDLVHLTDPFGAVVLRKGSVSTVHDLFPLTREEYSGTELRRRYTVLAPRVLELSGAVITPSDYIRNQLMELFPQCSTPLMTVPEAASETFTHDGERRGDPGHGLRPDGYFLFVGRIDRRKNLPVLLEAHRRLPRGVREGHPLVLVLSDDRAARTTGHTVDLGPAGDGTGPVVLRDLPDSDLVRLYANATAFVFPSLDEGFGLPVLEAMSAGCPVVTSGISCLPEVAGDAAVLVDPFSPEDLASAMESLATSPELRREYGSRGLSRARLFSWGRTARETMRVYRKLVP
ncbi:MAG: hypothetical protein AVO35_03240 [Candidatus Aegiribacteria sp. MLS_C]|nr:MAG: hypothetical protein AVO35_03240 [Candidatus Aegiribacteria sp. MLS_C]